jgi:hypothetical protein
VGHFLSRRASELNFPDGQGTSHSPNRLQGNNDDGDQVGDAEPEVPDPMPVKAGTNQDGCLANDHEADVSDMQSDDEVGQKPVNQELFPR